MRYFQGPMPFGKYKGRHLCDLPTDYIVWCLNEIDDLRPYLRDAMEWELEQRSRRWREAQEHYQRKAEPPLPRPDAVTGIVQTWFREMAMRFHPDRGGHVEAMKAINHAHDRLKELLEALPR